MESFSVIPLGGKRIEGFPVSVLVKQAEAPELGSRVTSKRSYCDSTSLPKIPLTFKFMVHSWYCICFFGF